MTIKYIKSSKDKKINYEVGKDNVVEIYIEHIAISPCSCDFMIVKRINGVEEITSMGVSEYCEGLYTPIHADYEKDTEETLLQIDLNNSTYHAICD